MLLFHCRTAMAPSVEAEAVQTLIVTDEASAYHRASSPSCAFLNPHYTGIVSRSPPNKNMVWSTGSFFYYSAESQTNKLSPQQQ